MWRRWGTSQNSLLAVIDELWKNPKNQNFEKWTTSLEISSFYTCVPKTTIIWGTVPEILSETEFFAILGHILPFWKNVKSIWMCHNFKLVQQKIRSYDVCLLRYGVLAQAIFCSSAPLLTPKIKIWKKCKIIPADIILLHVFTINQDHMHPWYDVWFLRYEVQQTELFCHLGQFFTPLLP